MSRNSYIPLPLIQRVVACSFKIACKAIHFMTLKRLMGMCVWERKCAHMCMHAWIWVSVLCVMASHTVTGNTHKGLQHQSTWSSVLSGVTVHNHKKCQNYMFCATTYVCMFLQNAPGKRQCQMQSQFTVIGVGSAFLCLMPCYVSCARPKEQMNTMR